ncbi:MAG: hypothetical protein EP306_05270 [Burkholderiales bacterium]|nr:MAG: hypothetical protein EP306_05270 [Burkholderiales bacterium]
MHSLTRPLTRTLTWGLLTLAVLLTGCAGPLRVDNQVRSFAQWSPDGIATGTGPGTAVPLPPQRYRFDRLPSQASGAALGAQERLETLAAAELRAFGWEPAEGDAQAPWRIQVSATTQRLARAPWEDPWDGYRGFFQAGIGLGGYGSGVGGVIWVPVLPPPSTPYYQREVSLVIRTSDSGRVVYETLASHDGRWNSTPDLWSAMLRAALRDFPSPPGGTRQVNIDIPR